MSSAAPPVHSSHQESRMVVSGREQIIGMSIRLLIVGVAIIFALFPVLYIILSAFNPAGQLSSGLSLPKVDSFSELFVNFRALMFEESNIWPFWRWIGNSFVVASVSTALTVLISALAAYSFSRFRFSGRRSLLLGILLIQVFPNLLALVAIFLMMDQISSLSRI